MLDCFKITLFLFLFILIFQTVESNEIDFQNNPKIETMAFTPSEMVVMSLDEWRSYALDMPKISEGIANYHASQPFNQDLEEFWLEPNHYFEKRLNHLQTIMETVSSNLRPPPIDKLISQVQNKIAYIQSLPNILDPRCCKSHKSDLITSKELIIRNHYWQEFLDPMRRSGTIMSLYKHLWEVSSIPSYFIYLDSIEHSPLLEKYAPQNQQVKYFHTDEERSEHKLEIKNGLVYQNNKLFDTSNYKTNFGGAGYGIFVLGLDEEFYFNRYEQYHLQHSSEFASENIIAAGEIKVIKGEIKNINNKSGHYGPTLVDALTVLEVFKKRSVPLEKITVYLLASSSSSSFPLRVYYNGDTLLKTCGNTLCSSAKYGWSPLQVAVWQNNLSLAKEAIQRYPINHLNDQGYTALHLAAHHGYGEWISCLLMHGANPSIITNSGYTALHIAASKGDLEAIKLLYPVSSHLQKSHNGETALLLSIKSGNIAAFKYLLEQTNLTSIPSTRSLDKDNMGNGALYFAIRSKNINMLQILIDSSLPEDLIKLNHLSQNLLHIAGEYSTPEIFDLLLSYGLNPYLNDIHGNSVLHSAVKQGNSKMVEHLLNIGFNNFILAENLKGITSLHYGAEHLPLDSFTAIALSTDNFDIPDKSGNTPLHYAIKGGKVQNLLHLLKIGANVNVYNHDGKAPIHFAAMGSNLLLKAMLTQYDEINTLEANGNNPLQTALMHYKVENSLFLISHATSKMIFHKNDSKSNAVDLAMELRDATLIHALRRRLKNLTEN